ncbi:pyrroline-5-carboxylate reductase [Herbivorax sp. ANBcel31]|uniref:pyrroline-5-carboxylate reductase n=1 Tax=Herbivorax sp. ANBcel31 TaxID=3069754 RepID=UPI0027B113DC|nr:pyrroline-5-carboxylate reductase [Herbivorax sp. ANBcel31]MDQ2086194.1 pyrroline-5-carboxylate reductase [Herbivorax sp. ANBcel31]
MSAKVGFIGAGNMGCAMINSIVKSGVTSNENVFVYDIDKEKLSNLKSETGITILNNSTEVVQKSDIVILSVKPNMVEKVLEPCKSSFDDKKILVSVAVGVPIKYYQDIIGDDRKIIRTMPNTPALVAEGMTLMCYDDKILSKDDILNVKRILECFGKVEVLDEKLMNEVTAVTGSSPAYVFMFIEAMADAAVLSGLPRDLSYKLAAQAVMGSAKLVLETGKHPGELKDQVCSPAGTTIEAVKSLEKNGFRHTIIDAMIECTKRAREIGKG